MLDKNPTDQLSSGTFWKTKNDFNMALASCYNTLQDYYLSSGIHDFDGISDNAVCVFSYANEQTINQNITVSSHATDMWYYNGYQRLATYNIFLQNLSGYKNADMTAVEKSNYEAQVRLMRAMEYYRLWTLYGSVPLVLQPLTVATQNVPKAPAEDVFKQIVQDCDFAIANLPVVDFWATQGHLNKAAAESIEARAYLYHGYDANGAAVTADMNKAASLTTDVINSGLYSLNSYYRGLFAPSAQTGNSREYLFAVYFLGPNDSKFGLWQFNISTMQFYWQSVHITKSLLDEYEFADGSAYDPNDPRSDSKHLYNNRDPRMAQTVCLDTVKWEDGTFDVLGASKNPSVPYLFWKSCDKNEVVQNGGVNSQKQNTNITAYVPMIRYAEVLLNHAEAVNEASGPTLAVYNDINAVRARAHMPALPSGLSQSQMRDKIRHERRVELAFEGFRYLDLKRWRIADKVLNGYNDGMVTHQFISPKNYLWPLPEAETQRNTALVQNPDYQ
jgi:hypothetical protein